METMFKYFDIRKEENGQFVIANKDREIQAKKDGLLIR